MEPSHPLIQSVCGVYGECELCVCQSSSVVCVSENRVPWFQGAVSHSRVPPLSAASLRDVLGSLILSIVGGIHPRSLRSLVPSARCVFSPLHRSLPHHVHRCLRHVHKTSRNFNLINKNRPHSSPHGAQMTGRSSALDPVFEGLGSFSMWKSRMMFKPSCC